MNSGNVVVKSSSSSKGIGFAGLLTIAFIVLKILGVITWSWWWVFSPIWITAIIIVLFLVIGFLAMVGMHTKDK